MSDLINITEHEGRQIVNLRELHYFLGSKQEYSTWIKSRIEKYDFIENEDFILLDKFVVQDSKHGGHNRIEYGGTLDMAKELSMVENNDQGRKARRYFIKMEKVAKQGSIDLSSVTRLDLAKMILEGEKERLAIEAEKISLEHRIKEDLPKVVFADAVAISTDVLLMRQYAKLLIDQGFSIGQNRLFQWFREKGYLIGDTNEPYQRYIEQGLFKAQERVISTTKGSRTVRTTYITGKGQVYFTEKLKADPRFYTNVLPLNT